MSTKQAALHNIMRLFEVAEKQLLVKTAFTPMYPGGSTPPADPNAAPPADPAAAGAPPMDPAMAGGQPPMDPAMMAQMQQMMMAPPQGAPAAPPAGPQGAPRGDAAAKNGEYVGEEEKLSTDDKLDVLMKNQTQMLEMIQAIGDMLSALMSPEDPTATAGGAPADPAAAGAPPMDPAMMAPPAPPAEPTKAASTKKSFADDLIAALNRDN